MIANLKHAIRNNETVRIGGGLFSPEELQTLVELIEACLVLVKEADRNGVSSLYENRENNPHRTVCRFGQALGDIRRYFEP